MDFNDVYQIKDEIEQIQKTYELFDEDSRLNHSKAARVEFLTTTRYIERYLKPGSSILDVGAGAGAYSLYLARKGYKVYALELAENNINAFRRKIRPEDEIDLVQGNAVDLSRYKDESFDAVLLFGPLYHLHKKEDQLRCIAEAKRVCKPDGKLFFAFISHDMIFLTELSYRPDYFSTGDYNKETFRLDDFPFVFHTVDECRGMLRESGVRVLHEVAADGASELMADKINAMDDEGYAQYLRVSCVHLRKAGASGHDQPSAVCGGEVSAMQIKCAWEHNGDDTLLYAINCVGAYTRGASREAALGKMPEEIASYLRWSGQPIPERVEIEILQEKASELQIADADSDIMFEEEHTPLPEEEYLRLKALALKSAEDFHALYASVPDRNVSCLPERSTFYGAVPRTAQEMYDHTKNVNSYYFGEIGVDVDNEGTILECRRRGFALLEQSDGFLRAPTVVGSYDELWSIRKVLRRFIWHDRIHAKAMYRMAVRTFGKGAVKDSFQFGE